MRNLKSKSKLGACARALLLAAAAAVFAYGTHRETPSWRCEALPASHAPTEYTIFFSKGIIAIGG